MKKKGESRITVGSALAVGLMSLMIVTEYANHPLVVAEALIAFFVPAFLVALIISGIFSRMNDKS